MTIKIKFCKSAFNSIYWPYLNAQQPLQIFYGGSSAGKSVFIAQRLINDLLQQRNYLVVRNVARTSRQSTFAETVKIIAEWKMGDLFTPNKQDLTITCKNGYSAMFAGLDDVEKLKSITPAKGILTDIWQEEATEDSENSFKHLERRLRGKSKKVKRMTMTFNPIIRGHWIDKRFFSGIADDQKEFADDNKLILKTTYKDNKWLSEQDINVLENEKNKYFYDVYTLGNWGVLGDVIFQNWKIEEIDRSVLDNFRYGLDFGYANDPAALIELAIDIKRKKIYILNELYETNLTNPDLAAKMRPICEQDIVVCDSAEPKSIAELKLNGINATGAAKGKDSILFGIQWLQQYDIIIAPHCQNAINEFRQYQWQKTKMGETVNRPVKKNDHIIDALRYATETDQQGYAEIEFDATGSRDYTQMGGYV